MQTTTIFINKARVAITLIRDSRIMDKTLYNFFVGYYLYF